MLAQRPWNWDKISIYAVGWVGLLVVVLCAFLVDRGRDEDGQAYSTYEIYQAAAHPDQTARRLRKGGQGSDVEQGQAPSGGYEQRLTIRGVPTERAKQGGRGMPFPAFVGVLAAVVTALGYTAVIATAIEGRPAIRARVLPVLPKGKPDSVRLENVGKSFALVVAYSCWEVPEGARGIPKSVWDSLTPLSRIIGSEADQSLDVPKAGLSACSNDRRVAVLVKYEDVFGQTWDAWRIFSEVKTGGRKSEIDGEQRGYKYRLGHHFLIPAKNSAGLKKSSSPAAIEAGAG